MEEQLSVVREVVALLKFMENAERDPRCGRQVFFLLIWTLLTFWADTDFHLVIFMFFPVTRIPPKDL